MDNGDNLSEIYWIGPILTFETKNVCAVITLYNPSKRELVNLATISKQVGILIIMDNSGKSMSNVREMLQTLSFDAQCKVIYFKNEENLGIPKSFNRGVKIGRKMGALYFFFLDQDSFIEEDVVKRLLLCRNELLSFNPGIVAGNNIGTIMEGKKLKKIYYLIRNMYEDRNTKEVFRPIFSGWIVSNELLQEVGPFNDILFLDAVDHEYSFRVLKEGYRNFICKNAIIHHEIGSVLYLKKSRFRITMNTYGRTFYYIRDTIRVARTYFQEFPVLSVELLLSVILVIVKGILFGEPKKDYIDNILRALRESKKS